MKTPTNNDTKDKSDDVVDGFEEEDEGGVGEEIREWNIVDEEYQSTNLMDDLCRKDQLVKDVERDLIYFGSYCRGVTEGLAYDGSNSEKSLS